MEQSPRARCGRLASPSISAALSSTGVSQNCVRSSAECSGSGPASQCDEVEQVHPLVDELTAARPRRVGAPLALVAEAAAVAVSAAEVHQLAVLARVHLGGGAREPRVEAVVEAHLHERDGVLGGARSARRSRRPEPGRLLDQHVRARLERPLGERRELLVGRRHDDHVGLEREHLVEVAARAAAESAASAAAALRDDVGAADELVARRSASARLRPISPQPTIPTRSGVAHAYSVANAPPNSKSNASSCAPAAAIAWRVSAGRRA